MSRVITRRLATRAPPASAAPANSVSAEYTARASPALSDTQPIATGPAICPNAKTVVNALIPFAQPSGGRLWRTKAVVDATADRNVAPNSTPDANAATGCTNIAGISVAMPSSALSTASAWPPRIRSSSPDHSRADTTVATPSIT